MSRHRWVRLACPAPTRNPLVARVEREMYGGTPFVLDEAPRTPFDSICLATDQEVGLFVRPLLPRPRSAESPA